MKLPSSRKSTKTSQWPRKVRLGRVSVTVYRRPTPTGSPAFMVANYADGKCRFDCYPTEADALDAAQRLARQLSEREVVAASLTNEDASNYAAAVQALAAHNVALPTAAATLAECLRLVGSLPGLLAASKDYARQWSVPRRSHRWLIFPLQTGIGRLRSVRQVRPCYNSQTSRNK